MPTQPSKSLETFPNPRPDRDYIIEIEAPEFTCLCPKTGQPDFATLLMEYVPDKLCVELKSLKLYIWSYRNEGHFHEDVTNRILYDLVTAVAPRYLRLTAQFNVRGGIYTTVEVEHRADGWRPPPPPPDHLPRIVQELPDKEGRAEPPRAILPGAAPPEAGGRRFRMLRRAHPPAGGGAPPPPPPPPPRGGGAARPGDIHRPRRRQYRLPRGGDQRRGRAARPEPGADPRAAQERRSGHPGSDSVVEGRERRAAGAVDSG